MSYNNVAISDLYEWSVVAEILDLIISFIL